MKAAEIWKLMSQKRERNEQLIGIMVYVFAIGGCMKNTVKQ